jgi:hypothetical protein
MLETFIIVIKPRQSICEQQAWIANSAQAQQMPAPAPARHPAGL